MEVQSENEKIRNEMFSLYFSTSEISKLLNNKIAVPIRFNTYFLVNKNWLDEYKLSCNYSEFVSFINFNYKNSNENETKQHPGNIKMQYDQKKRNLIFNKIELIKPQLILRESIKCPKNFVIINKKFFEEILSNIPQNSNDILKECCYQVLIGDDCIFIKSNENPRIYFICLFNFCNKDYFYNNDLDYLLIFDKNNISNIENEIKYYIQGKGFANYIQERKIKASTISQVLFNCKNQQIGKIINLKYERENPEINQNEKNNNILKGNNNIIKFIFLCLYNIPALQVYFSKNNNYLINKINKDKQLFAWHFLDFFINFKNDPTKSLEDLEKIMFNFEIIPVNQNNYYKLINFIYNKLDSELTDNCNNKQNSKFEFDENKSRKEFELQNQNGSFIQKLFYITQENEIACLCKIIRYHFRFLQLLRFDIENWIDNNLSFAVNTFLPKQIMNTNSKKKYCNMCSKESEYKQINSIVELPEILTIVLEGKYKNEININLFNDFSCIINNIDNYYMLICFINENEENKYNVIFLKETLCYYDDNYNIKNLINKSYFKPRVCIYSKLYTYDLNNTNNYYYNTNKMSNNVDNNMINYINNNNINHSNINNHLNNFNNLQHQQKNKNISDVRDIFLLFTVSYNKRQIFLEVNSNMIFLDVVKELINKYSWLKININNTTFTREKDKISIDKTIEENGLKSNDEIIIEFS